MIEKTNQYKEKKKIIEASNMKNKQFQGFVSRKENWNKDLFLRISMIETRANSPFFNCSKKCKKILQKN